MIQTMASNKESEIIAAREASLIMDLQSTLQVAYEEAENLRVANKELEYLLALQGICTRIEDLLLCESLSREDRMKLEEMAKVGAQQLASQKASMNAHLLEKSNPSNANETPAFKTSDKREEKDKPNLKLANPTTKLEDIVGNEDTIHNAVENFRGAFNNPNYTIGYGSSRCAKTYLLYGPPGTGKTMCAEAIANEFGYVMIEVDSATLKDKWSGMYGLANKVYANIDSFYFLGNTEKNINYVFEVAYSVDKNVLVFLDEVDTLISSNDNIEDETSCSQFGIFLRRLVELLKRKNLNVVLCAASNRPDQLPRSFIER